MKDWLRSPAPGTASGGGKFLSGWKKKPGHIDTWLVGLPLAVWQHAFPVIDIKEDKETKEKTVRVFPRKHTCHETEAVLAKQYWRETKGDPSSARETPPERCGMCKFIEWVWQECWAWLRTHEWDEEAEKWIELKNQKGKGKGEGIDPCTILFKLVSEKGDDETQVIYAGGLCGLFGRLNRKEKDEDTADELRDLERAMKEADISPREAWKGNAVAKPTYVMCIVDNDNPNGGVQIAQESKELGEKVKEEIIRVDTSNEINIEEQPYCIRWEYNAKATLGKQYKATALLKQKPTDRILKMVRGDQPDLDMVTTPFTQATMRATLERHCKVKEIPWDDFFPSKEQEKEWEEEDEAAEAEERAERKAASKRSGRATDEEEDNDSDDDDDGDEDEKSEGDDEAEYDEDGDEIVGCEKCSKPMKLKATKCPHCGHRYEDDEEPAPEPEPPPKKMRSRSEAKAAARAQAEAKSSKASARERTTKSKKDKADDDSDDDDEGDPDPNGDQEDDIPF